ncbi:hypothetical protein B0H14DRAFT_2634342 [Mycena olivaceomarginata]|nr:hypothetical protein B0H14DRAFT_2634342 [Mycena olivaceomarginata]
MLKSEPIYSSSSLPVRPPQALVSKPLRESLARTSEKNLGNWDQAEFEKLLVKWLVICGQLFFRSRLKPETIQTFKHHLRLKRKNLEDALLQHIMSIKSPRESPINSQGNFHAAVSLCTSPSSPSAEGHRRRDSDAWTVLHCY